MIIIDPDALGRLDADSVAGWEPGPLPMDPTSPRLSPVAETTDLGRVAHVSDETDLTSTDGRGRTTRTHADQAAEIEAAMAEARARLAEVPAEVVVTNHVMGLYELAAIHLSSPTPDLVSASLAIDAMALLVDGLGERLGDDAADDARCARQHPDGVRRRQGPDRPVRHPATTDEPTAHDDRSPVPKRPHGAPNARGRRGRRRLRRAAARACSRS